MRGSFSKCRTSTLKKKIDYITSIKEINLGTYRINIIHIHFIIKAMIKDRKHTTLKYQNHENFTKIDARFQNTKNELKNFVVNASILSVQG